MINVIKRLVMEEEGQGMVEYALILALIAVVAAAIPDLAAKIVSAFGKVANELP